MPFHYDTTITSPTLHLKPPQSLRTTDIVTTYKTMGSTLLHPNQVLEYCSNTCFICIGFT